MVFVGFAGVIGIVYAIVSAMPDPGVLFILLMVLSSVFNLMALAGMIWRKIRGPDVPFRYESDPPFEHDVRRRVPSVEKARRVLGFEATTTLEDMLDEVIPWVETAIEQGLI